MSLVRWILLLAALLSLPTFAAQQYSEAECILVKQQVADYKRRLGTSSSLYLQSKTSFDKHCQNPTQPRSKTSKIPAAQVAKHYSASTITPTQQPPTHITQPEIKPKSMVAAMLKPWLPIFFLCFFGTIAIAYFKKKLPSIKGRIGENHVIKGLVRHLKPDEYSIINDVTLPLEDGGTTQVDHIVVSRFGIFVIETKNMSGWIFGNEKQAKWTQTIHRSKHQFQNPLRQNYKHTKILANLLDMPHELFHSVVIFTPNAELKTKMPDNVGYLDDIMKYIQSFKQEFIDYKLKLQLLKLIDVIRFKQGRGTDKLHVEYLKETKLDKFKA